LISKSLQNASMLKRQYYELPELYKMIMITGEYDIY